MTCTHENCLASASTIVRLNVGEESPSSPIYLREHKNSHPNPRQVPPSESSPSVDFCLARKSIVSLISPNIPSIVDGVMYEYTQQEVTSKIKMYSAHQP